MAVEDTPRAEDHWKGYIGLSRLTSADGLLVACAAFNVMPVIEVMEHEFGVPVVTAHAAVLWQVFERLGIKEPLEGYGRLLRREYQPAGHRA